MTDSAPELLALHAVRVLGAPTSQDAARLFGLEADWVEECLLDQEALGLVRRTRWESTQLWSLTERGKAVNESQLRAEHASAGATSLVEWALEVFESVNGRFTSACTAWQLDETVPRAVTGAAAGGSVGAGVPQSLLRELTYCGARLAEITGELTSRLSRFGVHRQRYDTALERVRGGQSAWIDSPALPSLHLVWMGMHEDLLASLSRSRQQ